MSVKMISHEVVCDQVNQLKEMKENNLVFTVDDWHACPKAAKAVISILLLSVITLMDDMEKSYNQSSAIRELYNMFRCKLFCSHTEKSEKILKNSDEKDSAREQKPLAQEEPENTPDTVDEPGKKSWARRIKGFANKTLKGLKEITMFRNEEDTAPISEDDPEYPRDSEGNPMVRTGTEKTISLRYIPAQIIKVVSVTQKFISRKMINGKHEHKTIRGMVRGMFRCSTCAPEPDTLSQFAWMKFGLYMPANRIITDFKRHGIDLNRKTVSSWLIQGSQYLEKLMPFYIEKLFSGIIVQADETVVVTQKHKDSKENQAPDTKNYIWVYLTPIHSLLQVVFFDCGDLTRKIENPEKLIERFKGFLCTDAYPAYLKLKAVIHVFCLIHSRRKFVECIPANPGKVDPKIEEILGLFKMIFKYEEDFKEMSADERKKNREEHTVPLMNKIREKCEEIRNDKSVSKKGKLSTAANYFLNNWEKFEVIFAHGNIPLHNQASEIMVKPLKLGLKNYLTLGSMKGAHAACMYLTVFHTAMKNGLDPAKHLSYIFIQFMNNPDRQDDSEFLMSLLPWNPEVMSLCADVDHHENYNNPEWMEDFQRRVLKEKSENMEFLPEIEKILEEQQKSLEAQQNTAKKEAVEKGRKTREANKQKKQQKQILLDTFNSNKAALSPATEHEEFFVSDSTIHQHAVPLSSIQLE